MGQNKVKGYGKRGWLLIIWIATAFLAYTVIGNYPLNVLSLAGDIYGGQQALANIYTIASVLGVIIQLVLTGWIGKMKSVKKFGVIVGILAIIAMILMMVLPAYQGGGVLKAWMFFYGAGTLLSVMYGTFALSILVGQWFPTRKGSVMGIATFAFPIGNGLLAAVVPAMLGKFFGTGNPADIALAGTFAPFLIIFIIGLVIGAILIPDYPEQAGAFRDNNPNLTPEVAKAMMEEEIENKKTTVWKLNHSLTTRDFWFLTLPAGFLLMFSVGVMTQTQAIFAASGLTEKAGIIQLLIMIFGLLGSFLLGVLDEKLGTKKAMLIACIIMVIAGILGAASSPERSTLVAVALLCLSVFMGASSNFTVSLAAQYWRREDFSTVFSAVNPIANFVVSLAPALIAMTMIMAGYTTIFVEVAIAGVVSVILVLLFSAKHVKAKDDKYREKAGKPLDDALVGRK